MQLVADAANGARRLSAPDVSFLHVLGLGAGCQFRVGADTYRLAKAVPDAIRQEADTLIATSEWRPQKLDGRVILELRYTFEKTTEGRAGLLISATLTSDVPAPVFVESIEPVIVRANWHGAMQIGHSPEEWSILRNGWQSWSATRTYRSREKDRRPLFDWLAEMEENIANPSPGKRGTFVGEQVFAITNVNTHQSFVAGFLTCRRSYGDFLLELDPGHEGFRRWRARCNFDGAPLQSGEQLASEPLWLNLGTRDDGLLDRWAARSGAAMQARVPAKAPVGWCSWYHYYTSVTQKALLANLAQMAALQDQLPTDVFQLDDGYHRAIGDWLETNAKFPDGLTALAEKIAAAGYVPGIWTAPFLVAPKSRLAAEHPDWLLRDQRGKPVRGVYNPLWSVSHGQWTLDPTRPDVQHWLTETFAALRGMGWRFFKIDFLYSASLPGVRFDPKLTRAGALRAGLEAIRAGVGDDATILGCGCPLGPAVGIVDLMRIGPDVTPRWRNPMRQVLRDRHCLSTQHAVRNTITRNFLHRRWWVNDPDCVLAREHKNKLTEAEIRTFASLAAVSGGMFLLSDDMTRYPIHRLELVKTALSCRTSGMRVLDPDSGEFPSKLASRVPGGYLLLAINHSGRETKFEFDLATALADDEMARVAEITDVWLNQAAAHRDGSVDLGYVPAHGCRLLRVRLEPRKETHA